MVLSVVAFVVEKLSIAHPSQSLWLLVRLMLHGDNVNVWVENWRSIKTRKRDIEHFSPILIKKGPRGYFLNGRIPMAYKLVLFMTIF